MVPIPEGEFTMGYNIDNEWGDENEAPARQVFLNSYYMDRYEVSALQFSNFLNHHQKQSTLYFESGSGVTIEKIGNKFRPRSGLNNFPANRVSWHGASSYCRWVKKRQPKRSGKKHLEE